MNSLDHLFHPILNNLEDLNQNIKIAIFGAGETGKDLAKSLKHKAKESRS